MALRDFKGLALDVLGTPIDCAGGLQACLRMRFQRATLRRVTLTQAWALLHFRPPTQGADALEAGQ